MLPVRNMPDITSSTVSLEIVTERLEGAAANLIPLEHWPVGAVPRAGA
jgi:hypothetical protein